MKRFSLLLLVIASMVACSEDDSTTRDAYDRSRVLEFWSADIIRPAFTDLETVTQSLNENAQAFSNDPNQTNWSELTSAYEEAYLTWQKTSMFAIGPAEQANLRSNLNTYPADTEEIEEFISSGSYNLDLPSSRDVKGFPALDYLLYGVTGDNIPPLSFYQNDTEAGNYLDYLMDVTDDIYNRSREVSESWDAFGSDFVSRDGSSATASLDRLTNDYIFWYEKHLRAAKLGIPLGVFTGTSEPQTLESYHRPGFSKELAVQALDAGQDFFEGNSYDGSTTGPSFRSYLETITEDGNNEGLADEISAQFDAARESLQGLGEFRMTIENDPAPSDMLQAYDELQRLVPLFKVDMVSAMSISIDYVDADGD